MECREVIEAVCAGNQSEPVLEHLTSCASCRAQAHSTVISLQSSVTATDQVHPGQARRSSKVPLILIAVLAPVVGGLVTIALLARPPKVAPEPPPPKVVAAPEPKVEPIEEPSTARKLEIDSEPQGAAIFLDGKRRGVAPIAVELEPGKVLVEVRFDGYRTGRKTLEIGETDPEPLMFKLEKHSSKGGADPVAAAPPDKAPAPVAAAVPAAEGGEGFISIATEPTAMVSVDGVDTSRKTPILRMKASAGRHTVQLKTDDGTTITVPAIVVAGKEVRILKKIK